MKVYLSFARKDGAELAQRLFQDLSTVGEDVWLDRQRIARPAEWTADIEQALDQSDGVLALLTQGSYESEICRAEQVRALRKGRLVIPLLAQHGANVPLHLEARQYRDFSGSQPYDVQLRGLIDDLHERRSGVQLLERYRQTYVTAPPLPNHFIARPELLAGLRSVLLQSGGSSLGITSLQGMAGIGKTVLAEALAHDEVVQQAFPDGVVWTTVGKQAAFDFGTRMRGVRKALGDEARDQETELESINRYRTLMRDKAALVVVDDVWSAEDLRPFLADSPRSRLLFTTRDGSIAAAIGASEFTVDLLSEEQSRELLAQWAGLSATALPPEAAEMIHESGHLPLALSMIGAMLRGEPAAYWRKVTNLLRSADLEKIRVQFPNYPHENLLRAIQVSVEELAPSARARYFALAVMPENMAVDPAIQQVLWGADESDALETAELFVSRSLAERVGEGIGLHDLQLYYVRAQYSDRAALDLIHDAVRLSAHVIEADPWQFASQVIGRLLPHQELPQVLQFTGAVARSARPPWLRPLWPALRPPGSGVVRTLQPKRRPAM